MKTPPCGSLNDPSVLAQLDPRLLGEFLRLFALDPAHARLLAPDLAAAELCAGFAAVLASPEKIPDPIRQALRAIEDLAAPENKARLDDAVSRAPLAINIDPQSHPLQQALHLWLHHPFDPPPPPAPSAPSSPEAASPPAETPDHSNSSALEPPPDRVSVHPPLTLRLSVLFFEIDPQLRHQFFARFEPQLREAFPQLPALSPDTDAFDDAVFLLLDPPAFLPEPMREALLAIQELAAPLNRRLLRALVSQYRIYPDATDTPDQLALACWLHRPFPPGGLEPLRAQLPLHLREPVRAPDNGHNGDEPQPDLDPFLPPPSPPPPPAAPRPGDLAAIAGFPRNKISKLPPEVRQEINQMLRERVTYADIIARLGPRAQTINRNNLSRWKKTGHLVWLAEQQRREDAQSQIQLLFDLVRENDNGKLHEATQQIAALRISQLLASFDTTALTQAFQQHPQSFVRLVQTLPGLSRGGMDCERLVVELAERKAALNPDTEKKRGISDTNMRYLTEKLNLM